MENSGAGEIKLNNKLEDVKNFLDANDIEGAKSFLLDYISQNTDNTQAYFILAQVFEAQGDFAESANLYEKVFDTDIPLEFKDRILNVYEMADKYDKIYEIYKQDYEKNKNDADFCERFANTCCILNKTEEAISLYNDILSIDANNIIALKQLVDIYENENSLMFYLTKAKISELDENYEKAEKEYKKAFTLAEKNEDILQIRYKLAKLYKKLKKNEQALDEYNYILSETEENFSIFLETAEIYLELNSTSAAVNVLRRALHIYEDNQEAMQMLLEIYLDEEQYDKAEKIALKLIEIDSNNIEYKVTLAKIYLQLDKLENTKEILFEAEKIDNNNNEVITALAGYYTFVSDFEQAKKYCNRIIQKLPQSPLGYRKLAQLYSAMQEHHLSHFNYGIYHELKNEIEDAINEFTIVLNYKKDDYEAMKKLATFHEQMAEFEIAADYLHNLFVAKVDIIETTRKIVEIYIKLQDYQLAQKYVEEALSESDDIELKFLNAKCLYQLKDFESAYELLEYYKVHTKSLANIDETNKMLKAIEEKKENSYNPLAKIFNFFR